MKATLNFFNACTMGVGEANMNAMEKRWLCSHDCDGKLVAMEVVLREVAPRIRER
jgi:hypothetical protein